MAATWHTLTTIAALPAVTRSKHRDHIRSPRLILRSYVPRLETPLSCLPPKPRLTHYSHSNSLPLRHPHTCSPNTSGYLRKNIMNNHIYLRSASPPTTAVKSQSTSTKINLLPLSCPFIPITSDTSCTVSLSLQPHDSSFLDDKKPFLLRWLFFMSS